ncbi:MAG: hypothetical protein AMS25_10445 [Gemmatimonas sp. SM23_52]|nr:MAG: hypothetical protein AMS25_10445 [Gemmatimonas sp. SM23_52]
MTLSVVPGIFACNLRAVIVVVILASAAATACARRLPDPVPVPQPAALAERLRAAGTPDQPQLIAFKWRYRGREGRFSGEGAVRVNPPDSVRLDLLGPGWSGVQSAVLLGDRVYYVGEQRIQLPPPTFMWTVLGVFRPPAGIAPQGTRRGERLRLAYWLSARETVAFEFESDRLVEAKLEVGGDIVQRIDLKLNGGAAATADRWVWPAEARFRDLGEFHEVKIEVTQIRQHAPFEGRIFRVAARDSL